MTKADIAILIALNLGISKAKAAEITTSVFKAVSANLYAGNKTKIRGFGSFTVVDTKAKTGRNPQTGEAIEIPAGKRVKFTPAKALKDAVTKE